MALSLPQNYALWSFCLLSRHSVPIPEFQAFILAFAGNPCMGRSPLLRGWGSVVVHNPEFLAFICTGPVQGPQTWNCPCIEARRGRVCPCTGPVQGPQTRSCSCIEGRRGRICPCTGPAQGPQTRDCQCIGARRGRNCQCTGPEKGPGILLS